MTRPLLTLEPLLRTNYWREVVGAVCFKIDGRHYEIKGTEKITRKSWISVGDYARLS